MTVALVVAFFGLSLLFERHVERRVANELLLHLDQMISALNLRDGQLVLEKQPDDPRFSQPLSGLYWQVESGGETRRAMIDQFTAEAEVRFLDEYFAAAAGSPQLAMPSEQRGLILDLFLIGKAAYEIAYEAGNRPKWLPIPLRGLSMIVDRLLENDL